LLLVCYTSRNAKLVLITGRKTAGSSQQENVAPEILRGLFSSNDSTIKGDDIKRSNENFEVPKTEERRRRFKLYHERLARY